MSELCGCMTPTPKPDEKYKPESSGAGGASTWNYKETTTNIDNLNRDWSMSYQYHLVSDTKNKWCLDKDVARSGFMSARTGANDDAADVGFNRRMSEVESAGLRGKDFDALLKGYEGFNEGFDGGRLDGLWDVFDKDGSGTLDRHECIEFIDCVREALRNGRGPTEAMKEQALEDGVIEKHEMAEMIRAIGSLPAE